MKRLDWFANPNRFLRLARAARPWAAALTLILAAVGLYLALIASPRDYQQGESVRIMYIHVPAAWMALFCYTAMAISSAVALIWRHPLADIAAKSTAPVGAAFTFLALVTGSLWGKPMWGTWWVWDARLTSELILLFLYVGVMALYYAFDDQRTGAKAAAILAIVGVVNLPIIHYSVEWWNTLHQGATITKFERPSIATSMLWPLLISLLGFMLLTISLVMMRFKNELLRHELHRPWAQHVLGTAEESH